MTEAGQKQGRDLSILSLKVTYRTGDSDILNDFYVPCLQQSVVYKRAVGYFTSAGLAEAARGLLDFVDNDGHMLLVASPKLAETDVARIRRGYLDREVITESLIKGLSQPLDEEADVIRVRNLSWLIAHKRLDIKIALPTSWQGEGLYHEKLGLFFDSQSENKNVVTFIGSMNETQDALVRNYESIDVSVSWEKSERERLRVREHVDHFDRMWRGIEVGVETLEFPEAVIKRLIEAYPPSDRLTQDPGRRRSPFNFQLAAMKNWERAHYKGVLAMATGTGKTFTAIRCLENLPRPIICLIVVPLQDLIDQWEREIRSEYWNRCLIRKVSSAEPEWPQQLERLVAAFNQGSLESENRIFIISTIQTASRDNFRSILSRVEPENLAIVIDEVHHSGAEEFSNIFRVEAKYRLGLSATPERDWDDEGNQRIFDYFGPEVYEYNIDDGIRDGRLSKYKYYVHPTPLSPSERDEFRSLSQRIQIVIARVTKQYRFLASKTIPELLHHLDRVGDPQGLELQTLYLNRVKLLKTAESKSEALRHILKENVLNRCIIYCNDLDHLDECLRVAFEEGLDPSEYSSRVDVSKRAKLRKEFEMEHGSVGVLVAVRCLDEGVDLPACDSAVLVASSRSTREFIQRRGRILRLHPLKTISVIHDILVVPFSKPNEAYRLIPSEWDATDAEFRRAMAFAKSAENGESTLRTLADLKSMLLKSSPPN